MTSLSTSLGLLKVRSHRIEHALARHLSKHVDDLWQDVVVILRTKPYPQWERLILERHRLYVAAAYLEYERQMVRVVQWQREQLRAVYAGRFPWLNDKQFTTREDGSPSLLSFATVGLALASDTAKKWLSSLGLLKLGWFSGTRAGSPKPLLQTLKLATQRKMTVEEVITAIKPRLQQTKNSLAALARTAVAVVNTRAVTLTSRAFGCVGFQVHSVLEPATRWKHWVRHLTQYFYEPEAGEYGMDACPSPPYEADGSLAHNCLCWLTPIWAETNEEVDVDAVLVFYRRRRVAA